MKQPFRAPSALKRGLAILVLTGLGLHPLRAADNAPRLPPPPDKSADAAAAHAGRQFLGGESCVQCHSRGLPEREASVDPDFAAFFGGAMRDDSWVLFNEARIWTRDKHSQAYLSLLNDRSRRMGEILGIAAVHRDQRCLACHTGYPVASLPTDAQTGLVDPSIDTDRRVTFGVSCEGCHGAAGAAVGSPDLKGWYVAHVAKEPWRFLAPAAKAEQYGFANVRSPVERTKLCLSCHLGNAAEGRVVTHEMYAAGHPPLPPFEIETFASQMPEHWRDLGEKPEQIREEFTRRTSSDFDAKVLHDTRDLLVGAVVSLGESVKLSVDLAQDKDHRVTPSFAPITWPELAQFDCFACHHDLRDNGWRQRRPAAGPPGRPSLREWPDVLAQIAYDQFADDADTIRAERDRLREAVHKAPFGDREQLIEHGTRFAQAAEDCARKLAAAPIRRAEGEQIRAAIARAAARQTLDYDSARQLIWAFGVVDGELTQRDPDDPIAQALESLARDFVLDLRAGRTVTQTVPGSTLSREAREVDLSQTLPPIGAYEPAAFQAKFQQILKLLEPPQAP